MPAPTKAPRGPTDGELAFLAEYLVDRNATAAYMAVHPRANRVTARTQAARVLAKPYIRAKLRRMEREARRKSSVKAEAVLRELAAIAYSDIGHIIDFGTMTLRKRISPAARRAIASIRVRKSTTVGPRGTTTRTVIDVRLHSKTDALDKVSRHLGLYRELPPLEAILALLPPWVAEVLRAEMAARSDRTGGEVLDAQPRRASLEGA